MTRAPERVEGIRYRDTAFPQTIAHRFGAGGERGEDLPGLVEEPADLLVVAGVATVPVPEMQGRRYRVDKPRRPYIRLRRSAMSAHS